MSSSSSVVLAGGAGVAVRGAGEAVPLWGGGAALVGATGVTGSGGGVALVGATGVTGSPAEAGAGGVSAITCVEGEVVSALCCADWGSCVGGLAAADAAGDISVPSTLV